MIEFESLITNMMGKGHEVSCKGQQVDLENAKKYKNRPKYVTEEYLIT